MNIVYPGDSIVIAYAGTYSSIGEKENVEARIDEYGKMNLGIPGRLIVTWLPIGPQGSQPQVLFVYRERP
jgi:hypothetical protein